MKIKEAIKEKFDCGDYPRYITKRGKLLWIDTSHYNAYSSAANCKILIGADGKFWGYSDSDKIEPFTDSLIIEGVGEIGKK